MLEQERAYRQLLNSPEKDLRENIGVLKAYWKIYQHLNVTRKEE